MRELKTNNKNQINIERNNIYSGFLIFSIYKNEKYTEKERYP